MQDFTGGVERFIFGAGGPPYYSQIIWAEFGAIKKYFGLNRLSQWLFGCYIMRIDV